MGFVSAVCCENATTGMLNSLNVLQVSKNSRKWESAARDAYNTNAFLIILGFFCEGCFKISNKRQVLQGFGDCILPFPKVQVSPRNNNVFQHRGSVLQDAYKRNGFPMIPVPFRRNWLQNHQYSTGFIRFGEVESPMSRKRCFTNGFLDLFGGAESNLRVIWNLQSRAGSRIMSKIQGGDSYLEITISYHIARKV